MLGLLVRGHGSSCSVTVQKIWEPMAVSFLMVRRDEEEEEKVEEGRRRSSC